MGRVDRFFRIAYLASQKVPKSCKYKHGAVLANGSRLISIGYNEPKSNPIIPDLLCNGSRKRHMHAEIKAVCSISANYTRALCRVKPFYMDRINLKGYTLYVIRRTNNGYAYSKPCNFCVGFLSSVGLKNIWYTDDNGRARHMELIQ